MGVQTDASESDEFRAFALKAERAGQERLTRRVTRILLALAVLACGAAFLEKGNDPLITVAVYAPIVVILIGGDVLCHFKKYRATGWLVSTMFWLVIFAVTWFFGGLTHGKGSLYLVVILVATATLGNRAAVIFTALSIGSTGAIVWAEIAGQLPSSLAPASPINTWVAVSCALLITVSLIRLIVLGTRQAWTSAAQALAEKDFVEQKFLHAQRTAPIARLASGVAHDFNNLLNVMSGVSSLLRDAPGEDVEELLDELDLATTRATLMTGQLLALNRKRPVEPRLLDLTVTLETITPLIARLIGDSITLSFEAVGHPTLVRADAGQMEQLLLNLAVNSKEAMPNGGSLTIQVDDVQTEDEKWIRLRVSDTGEGMTEEVLKEVFTPFFTTKIKGTGLGLATVHDIIEKHDGSVRIESQVGQGTLFEVLLPSTEAADERSEPSLAVISPRGTARILLVEDHDIVRRTNRRLLESSGYDVTTVANGLEACSLIEGGAPFDLIISDISMPVLDGTKMALRLSEQGCLTPLLFISGHVHEMPPELYGLSTKTSFLGKPYSGDTFRLRVNQLLRGKASANDSGLGTPAVH